MLNPQDAQVSNIVVTSTLTICSMEALELFNSGTIYSLVAPSFALCLDMRFDVKQSIGSAYSGSGGVYNNQVLSGCEICIEDELLLVYLCHTPKSRM